MTYNTELETNHVCKFMQYIESLVLLRFSPGNCFLGTVWGQLRRWDEHWRSLSLKGLAMKCTYYCSNVALLLCPWDHQRGSRFRKYYMWSPGTSLGAAFVVISIFHECLSKVARTVHFTLHLTVKCVQHHA